MESKTISVSDYLKNVSRFRTITPFDIQQSHGSAGYPLWCHILDNSGCYERDIIKMEMAHYGNESEIMDEINKLKLQYTKMKPNLVTMRNFLNI